MFFKAPDRRSGNRALPIVANEIYIAIFDHLEPESPADMDPDESKEYRTTFSNLALVCRFFCAECLPRIFRSLEFSGLRHRRGTPSYSKFCRGLVAGEGTAIYLGKHVRECTISHWMQIREKSAWVFANFLKLYLKSIPHLMNLKTLRFHSTPLDPNFVTALGSLENLASLSLVDCEFISTTNNLPTIIAPLALLQFELLHHHDGYDERDKDYDKQCALVANLSDLVSSKSLRSLRTDNRAFLDRFLNQDIPLGIEKLVFTLFASQAPRLQDFLERTPSISTIQIEDLELEVFSHYPSPLLNLSPSALPILKELECLTPYPAEWLVPGRPLHSITIKSSSTMESDLFATQNDVQRALSYLKRSTVTITTLRVHKDMYMTPAFHQAFPQLETLILDFCDYYPVTYDLEVRSLYLKSHVF